MERSMSDSLILEPTLDADSCVIWLHGLGANRHDFLPVAEELQQHLHHTRFILPQAPLSPVTCNGGWPMPSWYDILALSPARAINRDDLENSSLRIVQIIEAQIKAGINPKRIFVAGFSQGGAVALHVAYMHWHEPLGGVLALSTYAPTFEPDASLSEVAEHPPALFLHGTQDDVVVPELGRQALNWLQTRGVSAQWREYEMSHEVCEEEITDICQWLLARLD